MGKLTISMAIFNSYISLPALKKNAGPVGKKLVHVCCVCVCSGIDIEHGEQGMC